MLTALNTTIGFAVQELSPEKSSFTHLYMVTHSAGWPLLEPSPTHLCLNSGREMEGKEQDITEISAFIAKKNPQLHLSNPLQSWDDCIGGGKRSLEYHLKTHLYAL